jgi:hypothetical protein
MDSSAKKVASSDFVSSQLQDRVDSLASQKKARNPSHGHLTPAPVRFSLDVSFDIGQDVETPGIGEYDAKMPLQFIGTLRTVEFKLGPENLTSGPAHARVKNRRKF